MARNFAAVSDKLTATSFTNPPTSTGTVSLWWNPALNPGSSAVYRLWEFAATGKELTILHFSNNNFYCGWSGFVGDDRAVFSTSGLFTSGTWINVIMTWDTGASPHTQVYFNNVVKGNKTGTLDTGTGFSQYTLGNSFFGNNTNASGRLAEVGIWDKVLSSDDRAALAKGYTPRLVQPANLLMSHNLVGSNLNSLVDNTVLSATGTSQYPHPRVIYPSTRHVWIPELGAAPTSTDKLTTIQNLNRGVGQLRSARLGGVLH